LSFATDIVELGELQSKLLMLDLSAASGRLRSMLAFALVGLAILIGSLPVAMFALAEFLTEQVGWTRFEALAIVAVSGLTLSGVLLVIAWCWMRKSAKMLDRSRQELRQNIKWLETTLRKGSNKSSVGTTDSRTKQVNTPNHTATKERQI